MKKEPVITNPAIMTRRLLIAITRFLKSDNISLIIDKPKTGDVRVRVFKDLVPVEKTNHNCLGNVEDMFANFDKKVLKEIKERILKLEMKDD